MNVQFEHSPQEKNDQKRSAENVGISMPSTILVHARLEMTNPGDSDEQEADEMADSIVNGGKIARSVSTGHSGSGIALPSQFGSQLASLQGHGSQLYGDLKIRMESGFGRDFSDVRLHTDDAAAEMSSCISAKAFTYGNDIYFNRGQYSPSTSDGQKLIAHELTHTLQQTGRIGRHFDDNVIINIESQDDFDTLPLEKIPYTFSSNPDILKEIDSAKNFLWYVSLYNGSVGLADSMKSFPAFVLGLETQYLMLYIKRLSESNRKGVSPSFSKSDILDFMYFADLIKNGIEDKTIIINVSGVKQREGFVDNMRKKSINNFLNRERRNDGKGITIAIMTDADTGQFYNNMDYTDNSSDSDYFYLLQGLNKLEDYETKMDYLTRFYGPLQNLIIAGHGSWDSIILGKGLQLVTSSGEERYLYNEDFIQIKNDIKNDIKKTQVNNSGLASALNTQQPNDQLLYTHQKQSKIKEFEGQREKTIAFFKKINALMAEGRNEMAVVQKEKAKGQNKNEDSKPKQSIYLCACLTNANHYGHKNFKETLQENVPGVRIWANSASPTYYEQKVSYKDGEIDVRDNITQTILEDHEYDQDLRIKTSKYDGIDYFARASQLGYEFVSDFDSDGSFYNSIPDSLQSLIDEMNVKQENSLLNEKEKELIKLLTKVKQTISEWTDLENRQTETLDDGTPIKVKISIGDNYWVTANQNDFIAFIREILFLSSRIRDTKTRNSEDRVTWKSIFNFANYVTQERTNKKELPAKLF